MTKVKKKKIKCLADVAFLVTKVALINQLACPSFHLSFLPYICMENLLYPKVLSKL